MLEGPNPSQITTPRKNIKDGNRPRLLQEKCQLTKTLFKFLFTKKSFPANTIQLSDEYQMQN